MDENLSMLLESSAKKYAEPVKALAGMASVYQGKKDDCQEDICRSAYEMAKTAVGQWLRLVLLAELIDNRSAELVSAELVTPTGTINQRISGDCIMQGDIFSTGVHDKERYFCQLGNMSAFAYGVLTTVKDNPVALFYKYLGSQSALLHDYCGEGLITKEDLRKHKVQDIFGLYKIDLLYRDITSIFQC